MWNWRQGGRLMSLLRPLREDQSSSYIPLLHVLSRRRSAFFRLPPCRLLSLRSSPSPSSSPYTTPLLPSSRPYPPPSPRQEPLTQRRTTLPQTRAQKSSNRSVEPRRSRLRAPHAHRALQIFQKVEEETERRAREEQLEEERSRPSTASRPSPNSTTTTVAAAAAAATTGRDPARDRRRGSISVSRFGQVCPCSPLDPLPVSPPPHLRLFSSSMPEPCWEERHAGNVHPATPPSRQSSYGNREVPGDCASVLDTFLAARRRACSGFARCGARRRTGCAGPWRICRWLCPSHLSRLNPFRLSFPS